MTSTSRRLRSITSPKHLFCLGRKEETVKARRAMTMDLLTGSLSHKPGTDESAPCSFPSQELVWSFSSEPDCREKR